MCSAKNQRKPGSPAVYPFRFEPSGNLTRRQWTMAPVCFTMKKVRMSRGSVLLGISLGVLGTLAVQQLASDASAAKPSKAPLERQEFHDTLDVVLDRYVEPVDTPSVMSRGLKHMVAGLDPYSHYMTAKERALAQKRAREGAEAGLVTTLRGAGGALAELEVIAVHPGSPAAKLGIGPGTKILELRDRPASGLLSNADARLLLSGASGERIPLTIDRGHGHEQLELELDKLSESSLVTGELVEHDGYPVAVIAIHAFRPGVGERVKKQLAALRSQAGDRGLVGLVLDVRGNPGGEVHEALVVADLFVEDGVLTRTRGRGGVILREELATSAGTDPDLPLVLVQDRRSASASELLAIALQDRGRAKIMGERSFGKGTVQELIGLPDGSLLTLTVARYFSPEDRNIDSQGVDPDVVLAEVEGDAAIEAACRELVARSF